MMNSNTFGKIFQISTFGESHGEMIGGIINGCPAGLEIDFNFIQSELDRRKPGQSKITTQRKESDIVKFVSGIFEGTTTGTPIAFLIPNEDAKSKDYQHIKESFRPSHADFTYQEKYGIRDYRGGGRSSARETACRVVGGAIAKQILKKYGIECNAFVTAVGSENVPLNTIFTNDAVENRNSNIVFCPEKEAANKMIVLIEKTRKEGDSIGGIVSCRINNLPVGLGEPIFDKLHADLAKAMLSINAVKGFEYGTGFEAAKMKGSEHNDIYFQNEKGEIRTKTNFSGGIQGGISNGEDVYFNVAFKPVATIIKEQETVDINGNKTMIKGKGRHDPCVVPRAVVIVESMAAITVLDHLLRNKLSKIENI
jgi:chorismate synthase